MTIGFSSPTSERVTVSWLPETTGASMGTTPRCGAGAQATSVCAAVSSGTGVCARAVDAASVTPSVNAILRTEAIVPPQLVRCLSPQFGDPSLGVLQVLAFLEFVDELFVEGERLGTCLSGVVAITSDVRFREKEIDVVAFGVLGIALQQGREAIDGSRIPLLPEVKQTDEKVGFSHTILRLPQPGLDLGHEGTVRIARDERLEFLDRVTRLRLITRRRSHLAEVRHREL